MKIKEINILDNGIEIKSEKKIFFKNKEYTSKIDIKSIDKIDRIIENDKLVGIILWHGGDVIEGIGVKNYDKDLEDIFNKIMDIIKDSSIKINETKL